MPSLLIAVQLAYVVDTNCSVFLFLLLLFAPGALQVEQDTAHGP